LDDVTQGERVHTILLSPAGAVFDQKKARELLSRERFILICGHYEGVDQRFIDACVDEEISIGDFVLTGGELAAMVITDAVCRMVPGVLSEEVCFTEESHWNGLLEYPQYTKPAVWHDRAVPEVLLSGHHANIDAWRRKMSLARTRRDRPDLFAAFEPQDRRDEKLLQQLADELENPQNHKP
ncbi:MAG TPA: tRNA (guanosine(37)-N1)-methyltransferase TrmD, partial [Clostridiales bacterium]|nr:tRNA (guanosine(37)-N1)-methyltransferase TrmD [Clostridiales bacterium]